MSEFRQTDCQRLWKICETKHALLTGGGPGFTMDGYTDLSRCRSSRTSGGSGRTISSATLCQRSYDLWRKMGGHGGHTKNDLDSGLMWWIERSDSGWWMVRIRTFPAFLKVSGFKDGRQVLSCHSRGLLSPCKRRKQPHKQAQRPQSLHWSLFSFNTERSHMLNITDACLHGKTTLGYATQWFPCLGDSACSVQPQCKCSTAVSKLLCVKEQP